MSEAVRQCFRSMLLFSGLFGSLIAGAKSLGDRPVLDDSLIALVNSRQTTWRAGRNARFENISLENAKNMVGGVKSWHSRNVHSHTKVAVSGPVPVNFDARTQWPNCIHPIRDQETCGGCWAFGAAETLSDRFCIASAGKVNVTLSPQDLLSCDVTKYTNGCDGGVPEYAWKYMETNGIATDSCVPYANNNTVCPQKCADNSSRTDKYKVVPGSTTLLNGAASAAQQDIFTDGPIQASFDVYQDFMAYKSGIYKHVSGQLLGKHSIKVVGFGVDVGVAYWIVANSWGPDWGMNGYFKIVRSSPDDCGIENEMVFGKPQL